MSAPVTRLYFLGEFGVFIQLALGAFERYFRAFPDRRVEILTFEDYGKLLSLLFPENIARVIPYRGPKLFAHRFGIGLAGGFPGEVDRIVTGMDDICGILREIGLPGPFYFAKQRIPNLGAGRHALVTLGAYVQRKLFNRRGPYFPVVPISAPIAWASGDAGPPTICILPRQRVFRNSIDRNVGASFWSTLITDVLLPAFRDQARFVLCGLEAERIEGLRGSDDFVRPKDILEEVALLNRSAVLITPMSGYGQFGSFCGANVFYVLPDEPIVQEHRHIATVEASNIFGRELRITREANVLAGPDMLVEKIRSLLAASPAPASIGNSTGEPSA